jgi:GATA-binding protein, other eukaryote
MSNSLDENSKRLSSIKSILNPPGMALDDPDHYRQALRSPDSPTTSAPSPGSFSNSGYAGTPASLPPSTQSSARDPNSESEKAKAERRAMLQREAEKMRELLAAKERELAELALE